jgi:phosphoglucosamine mutase
MGKMAKLFGTDGIRGKADIFPMTSELVKKVGMAVGVHFGSRRPDTPMPSERHRPLIVVGRDTRQSGPQLEAALTAGLCAADARVRLAGVMPTPAVAYLCRQMQADAGIVISASHNPYEDNGVKIFDAHGRKLSVAEENALESLILDNTLAASNFTANRSEQIGHVADGVERYVSFLASMVEDHKIFKPMEIALDCANGATSQAAPALFKRLGAARVHALFCAPDGVNINAECGSEHPEALCQQVVVGRFSVGLAFDGDGDRLVAVDEKGRVISGDQVSAICAAYLQKTNRLDHHRVVATVMSNIGLSLALKKIGVELLLTDVGDRHVMEKMMATGAVWGGENSGHMIYSRCHSTGDGLLSALILISAMAAANQSLSCLADLVPMFPQAMINVTVKSKPPIDTVEPVRSAIAQVERQLAGAGRVLVRYSGTQSVCRVMVEGPTEPVTQALCGQIAEAVASSLG